MNARELRDKRTTVLQQASDLLKAAETADRDFSPEEKIKFDGLNTEADSLLARAERLEKFPEVRKAPEMLKIKLGDSEERAFAHFARTGDNSGLRELRASNATDMNIGTAADGGNAVPTGHYQGIIARRDESMLAKQLGVRQIPGKGTTVNVPLDGEDDGEFVVTSEAGTYDLDAPAIGTKALTLLKYTKQAKLSEELLEDEDSKILAYLNEFVGRGMAKTHNTLLLAEVASNGTAFKTFASGTVIAVDELEAITYNDALDAYLDDTGSVAWVMKRSVHGEIALLDDASQRRYLGNVQGDQATLLGFPVKYSVKAGATAVTAKSVYFGNWNYVGYREAPGLTVLRDPYTLAASGQILMTYMFRCVYGVLQAEAIGYGKHPTS